MQIGEEVPALISPMKPKFYLLGDVTVDAGCAVKLKWNALARHFKFWDRFSGSIHWVWMESFKESLCDGPNVFSPERAKLVFISKVSPKPQVFVPNVKEHVWLWPCRGGLCAGIPAPVRYLAAWNVWKIFLPNRLNQWSDHDKRPITILTNMSWCVVAFLDQV